ncbi:MAG: hypothetical protein OEN56_04790 [Gemmatimonadota bacterium]|nr:hypothetical protein [Gemmatimonadota bacterium]MDH3424803.1 hypothetical protein [Gemmatimonadota bacterium]
MNVRPATLALSAVVLMSTDAEAQRFVAVPPPPNQPMAEDFDPERALFFATPNFVPLRNPEWTPLSGALGARDVAADTPVLTFEAGGKTLVLVSSQMSYHHVAQGEMAGEPWMVTF